MIEQIKKINNPLTIIAIFAALAEINATIAIGLIDKSLHNIFIWFIIGFPTLLIVFFFWTLNFNTKTLYSPSDYREDKTFLDSLYGQKNNVGIEQTLNHEQLNKSLLELEQKLIGSIDEKLTQKNNKSITESELRTLLENYKTEIKTYTEKAIEDSSVLDFDIPRNLKNEILKWISYPAFIPIVYAIYKENSKSVEDLEKVKDKYNLPERWKESGIPGLLSSRIISGKKNRFDLNPNIEDSLSKWIQINEHVILAIVSIFGLHSERTSNNATETTRELASKLIIE